MGNRKNGKYVGSALFDRARLEKARNFFEANGKYFSYFCTRLENAIISVFNLKKFVEKPASFETGFCLFMSNCQIGGSLFGGKDSIF